jgi:hypothetical protein
MTAPHVTVTGLTRKIGNLGHKLYMDNFFSSCALFNHFHTKAISCCGSVRPNRKEMPVDFGKTLKLKWGDIRTGVRGDLTAILW